MDPPYPPNEGPTLVQRRRRSSTLSKLIIPDVEVTGTTEPSLQDDETVAETRELFNDFLNYQIESAGLERPQDNILSSATRISTPQGYQHPEWAKAGRELRIMADEFAQTRERNAIRQRAERVNSDVTFEQFSDMLSELFSDGFPSRHRILFLFFFCADVAIKALKKQSLDLFKKFIDWSIRFITEKVSKWVFEHGGWGAVINSSMTLPKKIILAGVIVLIGIGLVKLYRNRL